MLKRVTALLTVFLTAACSSLAPAGGEADPFVAAAPETAAPRQPLVLLLSGDGDWAAFPKAITAAVTRTGAPVIGLKSRTYLSRQRTPEEAARLLQDVVERGLREYQRDSLVIIGYSRGADMAPFILNRWPEDLRGRVRRVALVGFSENANFLFHTEDLWRNVHRPSDLPTRPEVAQLRMPVLCVGGVKESDSFCKHPLPSMRVFEHTGGHVIGNDQFTVQRILKELAIT